MAIFIFKILALVIRTTAKPIITWATYYNRLKLQESNKKNHYIRKYIIWIGQITNYYNTKFNRKFFRLPSSDPIKRLTDDKAIEKGAEVASEILIYTILLSLPILEWWRQSKINKAKEEMKEIGLKRLRIDVELLSEENQKFKEDLKIMKNLLSEINSKL
jgi:hypothetical protein